MLSSLSRQLASVIAAFILITTVVVAIPAYLLIRSELQNQMLRRLDEAERHTQTLLTTQMLELSGLLQLAAERPTLESLREEGRRRELNDYLATLGRGTLLDFLFLRDTDGTFIAGTAPDDLMPNLPEPLPNRFSVQTAPPMVYTTMSLPTGGYLTGGFLLDQAFIQRMADQTHLDNSLIVDGQRTITSLPSLQASPTPDSEVPYYLSVDDTNYYSVAMSILDSPVHLEVLMPVQDIINADRNALVSLFLSAATITLLGSMLGRMYVRRVIRPLDTLTQAADKIGRGQLTQTIAVDTNTHEIRLLADTLEQSRLNLLGTLDKLSEARNWSEALIQAISEGIITFDSENRISFFSEGAARLTGWTVLETLSMPLDEVLKTPENDPPFTQQIPGVGSRQIINVETPSGEICTFAVTRARATQPGQSTVVTHDITEETHLRNLQAYFIANISHEFRTPLSGLRVSIELLLENAHYLSPTETDELLNSILLSVSSLQNLIDNLLESTKIEASRFTLRRRETTFNTILAEAIRVMQPIFNRRNQRLCLTESFQSPTLYADPVRLTQVMVNLLSNASKYSPQETVIDVRVLPSDHRLTVEVADRGEGVAEEERADIFRRFLRRERASSEDYGVGLGLFVVKSIVEEHGGEVGVSEHEGGGAIFWFTLPLQAEELIR